MQRFLWFHFLPFPIPFHRAILRSCVHHGGTTSIKTLSPEKNHQQSRFARALGPATIWCQCQSTIFTINTTITTTITTRFGDNMVQAPTWCWCKPPASRTPTPTQALATSGGSPPLHLLDCLLDHFFSAGRFLFDSSDSRWDTQEWLESKSDQWKCLNSYSIIRYPEKKVKVIYFTFFYHQVLCQLVEGENNFTFEFLGVKVQKPVHKIKYLF